MALQGDTKANKLPSASTRPAARASFCALRLLACEQQHMAAGARAGFAGQHYIIGIMQSVAGKGSINKNYGNPFPAPTRTTVLHNAPLCKVGLWRATRHLASLFQAWLGGFW